MLVRRSSIQAISKKKGSLTVEAALILPIFLFAITAFLYFFQVIYLQIGIQSALNKTAEYYAMNAYLYTRIQENVSDEEDELTELLDTLKVEETIERVIYEKKFYEYLDEKLVGLAILSGGRDGICIQAQAEYFEDDKVDLCAYYTCKVPILFIKLNSFDCVSRSVAKNWTGQDAVCRYKEESSTEDTTEVVYMTETGTKYHTYIDCSHLKLSIRTIAYEKIPYQRNKNHGKYKGCELCTKHVVFEKESIVYITDDGTRYHSSKKCSGLKRTIKTIPRSEISSDIQCCKRCQKREQAKEE